MLGHDPPVLADHNAIGVSVDVDRTADRAGAHRVLVIVEPDQAGFRDRGRQGVEAIEAAAMGNELRPLLFEDLPDRLPGPLGVGVRFRPGKALVEKPAVQFVVALEPQPRREKTFANQADLVFDLTLLSS